MSVMPVTFLATNNDPQLRIRSRDSPCVAGKRDPAVAHAVLLDQRARFHPRSHCERISLITLGSPISGRR
jgi:hypothetical protein